MGANILPTQVFENEMFGQITIPIQIAFSLDIKPYFPGRKLPSFDNNHTTFNFKETELSVGTLAWVLNDAYVCI